MSMDERSGGGRKMRVFGLSIAAIGFFTGILT